MKKNNKGFSLVELIIVIAIMAILAGALAPALIKYIAKSRRSTDVSNAQSIATAVTNALASETAYDAASGGQCYVIKGSSVTGGSAVFANEVASQLGGNYTPKYEKTSRQFDVVLDNDLKSFKIYVGGSMLYPDVCDQYK
jgi:type IV pilus assembly protein PilA